MQKNPRCTLGINVRRSSSTAFQQPLSPLVPQCIAWRPMGHRREGGGGRERMLGKWSHHSSGMSKPNPLELETKKKQDGWHLSVKLQMPPNQGIKLNNQSHEINKYYLMYPWLNVLASKYCINEAQYWPLEDLSELHIPGILVPAAWYCIPLN